MKFRGGEFSTGTKGNFQSELTFERLFKERGFHICASILAARLSKISSMHSGFLVGKHIGV